MMPRYSLYFTPSDLLLYCGGLDAARYNAVNVLEQGKSLILCPGGATEALYAFPGMR